MSLVIISQYMASERVNILQKH